MAEQPKLEKVTDTLSVYQQKGVFFYGTDAVLLAAYASACLNLNLIKKSEVTGIELCSGTGFSSLSMLDRFSFLSMTALEINKQACRLSEMSAETSELSDRFTAICGDVRNVRASLSSERYDFAICNPPYMTDNCGKMCRDDYKTIARHEILCNIGDVFKAAYFLLGTGGSLFIVYRPDRLSSLYAGAAQNRFEIKRMTLVCSKEGRPPVLVLCEAKKQGKEGLVMTAPFIIYDKDGNYTEQMDKVAREGVMELCQTK